MAQQDAVTNAREELLRKLERESTAQVRKELGAALEAARTEQDKLNNIAEHAGELGKDKAAESGQFWAALCNVMQEAKAKGLEPALVIVGTEAALGNPATQTNTVRQYRSTFAKVCNVYMSDEWENSAKRAGVPLQRAETDKETGNVVNKPLNLAQIGYANARKVYSVSQQSDEQREFERTLAKLVETIKTASKDQAPKPKEGIIAMKAVPFKQLTEALRGFIAAVPKRKERGADAGTADTSESNPMEDAVNDAETANAADADDASESEQVRKAS